MGELPRRVMAALAQNPLSHTKPLRRDRIREKVLNYLTKLATGTAKVPTSKGSQTEETSPQKPQSQIFFTWRRQQKAQSRTI